MSDLHDLYLVQCPKNTLNPVSRTTDSPSDHAKKESSLGQEATSSLGFNPSLALTFISSDSEPNLSTTDYKIALKNATESQQHAKDAIAKIKASRIAKKAIVEQIQDREDFRKVDAKERKIIRIENNKVSVEPEFSDTRKFYYNASKEIK